MLSSNKDAQRAVLSNMADLSDEILIQAFKADEDGNLRPVNITLEALYDWITD